VSGLGPPTNYYGGKARLAGWIASLPAHRPLAHQARLLEPEAGCCP
jgi:hypothetical protein